MQNFANTNGSKSYSKNSLSNLVQPPDGFRWKRKAIRARVLTGFITIAFTALLILLVVTFELKLHCPSLHTDKSKRSIKSLVKFLHASDIHLDLYYDPNVPSKPGYCRKGGTARSKFTAPYGRVGCDSPELLVSNAIKALKNEGKKQGAEFFLFTGDMSSHRPQGFSNETFSQRVLKAITRGNQLISESFSEYIPVFPMFGNNDLPGHYVLPNSTSNWYQEVLKLWAPLITCSKCPSSVPRPTTMATLEKSFLEGGYYNASIAGGTMTLLVLNTMYFNVLGSINTTFIQNKAKSHMQWIEDQLQLARDSGKKVILASHIPPGVDSYSFKPFWLRTYSEAYVKLVRDTYRDVVAGQLYAHVHKDDFQLQISSENKENTSFVLLVPSISPVYKNNPGFRVISLDPQQQALADYDQYFLDLVLATEFDNPLWKLEYRFNEKYPSSNPLIDWKRIDELNQNLINQTGTDTYWKEYISSRQVLYQPDPFNRFELYCAMRHVFEDDFKQCAAKYKVTGG